MNDGKVIVQLHPSFASSNVKFIRLPAGIGRLLRKSLEVFGVPISTIPRLLTGATPHISGAVSLALDNRWTIVTVLALYRLYKQKSKKVGPKVAQIEGTLTKNEIAALKDLQPLDVMSLYEQAKLSCLAAAIDRLLVERVDTVATEIVALPMLYTDLKAAREVYYSKRELLLYACGSEACDTLLQKKWEQVATWRQHLATTTEAVDIGLQRASFVQELEWKDFSKWQQKLKLLDSEPIESKQAEEGRVVNLKDPVYQAYQKWESVIA